MPLCFVDTNLPKEKIPSGFHLKLSKALSEILNKPAERIAVVIHPDVICSRGGTDEPNAVIQIWSIGVFNKDSNPGFFEKLVKFFKVELPTIPENRLGFCFHPIEQHDVFTKK